jgi:hypothetical protein
MSHAHDDATRAESAAAGHELTDAHAGPLGKWMLILFALCAASFASMRWLHMWLADREEASSGEAHPLAPEREIPPNPRLQSTWNIPLRYGEGLNGAQPFDNTDVREVRAREVEQLSTYGWIDRPIGVVHIPIEQAMKRTVEKGLPRPPSKTQ